MTLLKIGDKVKMCCGPLGTLALTGKIVGHGVMQTPSGITMATYAVLLDEEFQGYIHQANSGNNTFVSTLLVCADGVTQI